MLFSEIICRICSFATAIKILLFDKNSHICILTKKEPFFTRNTNYFTLPKKELRWHKISAYFCFILFTSAGYYLVHQVYITFALNILSLSIISLCYTGTVLKKFVVVTSIYVVNIMTESLLFFMPASYPGQDSVMEGILQCIMGMGMLAISVLYEKTIELRTKNMELPAYLWGSVLLIPLLSFAMMLKITMIRRSSGESVTELILGILIINVLIIYLYDALQNYYKEKADKENLKKLVSGYSRQLNIMTESYAQIREIRHDLKHHIFSLTHLIQNNRKTEALDYISQMERHICNPEEYASSGNKEIDSILNYFLNEAKGSLKQLHVHIGISNKINLKQLLCERCDRKSSGKCNCRFTKFRRKIFKY